jgi:hypothetical protein
MGREKLEGGDASGNGSPRTPQKRPLATAISPRKVEETKTSAIYNCHSMKRTIKY